MKKTRKLQLNRESVRSLTNTQVERVAGGGLTGNGDCWVNTVKFDCYGRTGAATGCAGGSGWQECGFVPGR